MVMYGDTVSVRDVVTGAEDTFKLGPSIASGFFRQVFELGDGLVAKCETYPEANNRELDVWLDAQQTPLADYLCPIIEASADSTVLVQPRMAKTVRDLSVETDRKYSRMASAASCREEEDKIWREGYRESDRLDSRFRDFVRSVSDTAHAHGWVAHDLHEANVGIDRDGNYIVIDYGEFRPIRRG